MGAIKTYNISSCHLVCSLIWMLADTGPLKVMVFIGPGFILLDLTESPTDT